MLEMNSYKTVDERPTGALEIAVEARKREREMEILRMEFESEKPAETKKRSGMLRALLASLFLS